MTLTVTCTEWKCYSVTTRCQINTCFVVIYKEQHVTWLPSCLLACPKLAKAWTDSSYMSCRVSAVLKHRRIASTHSALKNSRFDSSVELIKDTFFFDLLLSTVKWTSSTNRKIKCIVNRTVVTLHCQRLINGFHSDEIRPSYQAIWVPWTKFSLPPDSDF